MPHDINNHELHVGDTVTMRLLVKELHPSADICNATLECVDAPEGGYRPAVTCNTGSVALLEQAIPQACAPHFELAADAPAWSPETAPGPNTTAEEPPAPPAES